MNKSPKNKVNKQKIENKLPPSKDTKNEKIISIDKKEEEMLKGQIHEEKQVINEKNSNINSFENKKENQKEDENGKNENKDLGEEKKQEIKKEIIVKPRETYLKDKIQKSFSQALISNVNKSLDNQMQNIKIDLKENKILIRKNSNNLKKLIPNNENKDKIFLTSDENYKLKNKMKQIKELKDQEKLLQNKLSIILSNEKFLNEKDTLNFSKKTKFLSGLAQGGVPLENRLKILEFDKIKQQKEELLYKIKKIQNKIKDIININDEQTKKLKIKNFLDNFNRDKEIIEIRAQKYYQESKQIQQRMKNDIDLLVEKKKKEMKEKEEKIKKEKNDYIEKFRIKEKEIENKRLNEYKKKVSLFQSFSFNKPESKPEDYLFNIKTEKYLKKEENYFRKEKNKRKFLIKSFTKEELEDFSRNYDDYKNEYYRKAEEKQKQLFLDWKKRKEQLPNFMSSFFEYADLESKKYQENERESKEKIEYLLQNKKEYSEKVKNEKVPIINQKLKNKRLNSIFKLENPKLAIIKDAILKRKKRKMLSESKSANKIKSILKNSKSKNKSKRKSKSKSKPNSSKSQNNIKYKNYLTELNKSEIIKKNLIHKPKKIKFVYSSSSTGNIQNKKVDKKIDYLKKMYNNKTYRVYNNYNNKSLSVDIGKKDNRKKWDDLIKQKNNSLLDNIGIVKKKADDLDREADITEKKLLFSGGVATNPKLGEKVSNLLLDSIQAKLSILNQMNKQI